MNVIRSTGAHFPRCLRLVAPVVAALSVGSCGGPSNTSDSGTPDSGGADVQGADVVHPDVQGTDAAHDTGGNRSDVVVGDTGGSDVVPVGGGGNLACGGASFRSDAPFYQDISTATLDSESANIMAALERDGWAPAGARQNLGVDFSFVINCADAGIARTPLSLLDPSVTDDGSDTAPVPLPPGGEIEGGTGYSCSGGDCHLLVYQGTRLYEVYQANLNGSTLEGGFLAVWDLTHNFWDETRMGANYSRGEHCDGGNGGDLPIAPKLLTLQELNAALAGDGIIHHALRFTIPNARIDGNVYVHPATHTGQAGLPANAYLPYGARLRLRSDFDLASLPNDAARVVARTLQHYGMYLEDGGNIYISASVDASDVLASADIGSLRPRHFEMVDGGARINWGDYQCMHTTITQ